MPTRARPGGPTGRRRLWTFPARGVGRPVHHPRLPGPRDPFGPRYRANAAGNETDLGRDDGPLGHAAGGRPPLRVVIADDNPGVRTLLRALLSLEDDLELVGEAADGKEAIELVRECEPDLVLLDMAMPELDGLQVLERLDFRGGKTRVLVYTGFASPDVERAALELGATDIVIKGVDPAVLIDRLRRAGD